MKNAAVGKAIPFILPIAIWLAIMHYMVLGLYVIPQFMSSAVLACVINGAVQIAFVCVLTVIAAKEYGFGIKKLVITLPVMFVSFAVYHIPSLYIFVYTAEWSFFFTKHDAMNRFLAAFWITLQYGIIMLITLTALYANKKTDTMGE